MARKDGYNQLVERFISSGPGRERMLDEEIINAEAAQMVYDLRTKAGLTQRELARRVGTTASVISRLEQADYEGSLPMLRRIAAALGRGLSFTQSRSRGKPASFPYHQKFFTCSRYPS